MAINEVKTSSSGKIRTFFEDRGYNPFVRIGGGIAIAAQKKLKMINVTTTKSQNIIAGYIPGLNVRLIAVYGPQENVPKEDRQEFFDELSTELQSCEFAGNSPLVVGDLNSKLVYDDGIEAISSNGEMLKEVIENHSLKVLNFDKCCKGKWTRVQTVKGVEVKSVLDYCLSSGEVVQRLESMIIDEEKLFCPFRVKKIQKVAHPQYSDHNALLMVFKMSYKETRK